MIISRETRGDRTWELYNLKYAIVLASYRGDTLDEVWFSREVERVTTIVIENDRGTVPGLELTKLEQRTAPYMMTDSAMSRTANRPTFIIDDVVLVKFSRIGEVPFTIKWQRPIVEVYDHDPQNVAWIVANNLFDTMFFSIGASKDTMELYSIPISEIDCISGGIYTDDKFSHVIVINGGFRMYVNTNRELCAENGRKYALRRVNGSKPLQVYLPKLNMNATMFCYDFCETAYYIGGKRNYCAKYMETSARPFSGTICRSGGFEFVVLNGQVIYCQTYDPTCPLEIREGVLTMPGNQVRLLTGLIVGENITVKLLTVGGTYCVARTGDIYKRMYHEEFINTTQDGVIIIANRDTRNCVSYPIANITVGTSTPAIFMVDAISDVHHMLDGTVIYKASNDFHQTETTYESVRQINEYSIELDGAPCIQQI